MLDLSVFAPVYRCEECLRALYDHVTRAVAEISPRYVVDERIHDAARSASRGRLEVATRQVP